jgi:DNA transformation protein
MNQLTKLPNIGKALVLKLNAIDITSFEELKAIGSKQAIIKISTLKNSGACINMLYALEGAIQGLRWHGLNKEKKLELKAFYNLLSK